MHPILIPGPFPIYSYGVFLGLSCVLGAHIAVHLSERDRIDRARAWWMAIIVILVGLLGAGAHDVIVNSRPTEELLWLVHSGRTAYGAFISAVVVAIVASRALRVPFWRFGDAAAPTLALGLALTRIGCFLAGCDYGLRCDPPLGVCFPTGSPAWEDQSVRGLVNLTQPSLPVFPVQLLESAVCAALIAPALLWVWKRRPRREGAGLLAFFVLYGLVRAAMEQVRGDSGRGELAGLSTSTTIGLLTAAAAGVMCLPPLARLRPEAGPLVDLPVAPQPTSASPAK